MTDLSETVIIHDKALPTYWEKVRIDSVIVQDTDDPTDSKPRRRWRLKSYLVDGNTNTPLHVNGISFSKESENARHQIVLTDLPERLFRWPRSPNTANPNDEVQVDLPIDELLNAVPRYLALAKHSMVETSASRLSMTYEDPLSSTGSKVVLDEAEYMKNVYTDSALLRFVKDVFNDPWDLKKVQDDTFTSQKQEFHTLMNAQTDKRVKTTMKNWRRGAEQSYDLSCQRSSLKSFREFLRLLPDNLSEKEQKTKDEKSTRMFKSKKNMIGRLEDRIEQSRRAVWKDLKLLYPASGNDSGTPIWPEDTDAWKKLLEGRAVPVTGGSGSGAPGLEAEERDVKPSPALTVTRSINTPNDTLQNDPATVSSSTKMAFPVPVKAQSRVTIRNKNDMTGWDTTTNSWKRPPAPVPVSIDATQAILDQDMTQDGFTLVSAHKPRNRKKRGKGKGKKAVQVSTVRPTSTATVSTERGSSSIKDKSDLHTGIGGTSRHGGECTDSSLTTAQREICTSEGSSPGTNQTGVEPIDTEQNGFADSSASTIPETQDDTDSSLIRPAASIVEDHIVRTDSSEDTTATPIPSVLSETNGHPPPFVIARSRTFGLQKSSGSSSKELNPEAQVFDPYRT
ncbi:hypothetical protein I302_107287 [Kwoniella bestiolae CBS 10118]|uniref:Uncharacterized protein n=1 Tax=Kwoniella bestiolae CBS 10118 TaxID=1296100 RepID=A0A1B9FZ07_9TREE|nr:hypothetical protein I302_06977 [Kwoniella bestiolae CBS 10118]OCF23991.1 hypothetical protein I302_06977 [Kwoniella bestiolae CBS 10118]